MKASDVRAQLRGKIHPDLLSTLETLAEQDHTRRGQIKQLADLVNDLMDQFHNIILTTDKFKKLLKKKKVIGDEEHDDDAPTH